jgi:hypothetical protein
MAIAKPKNPAAVALGRKGGKAKAKRFTAAERSEAARKARAGSCSGKLGADDAPTGSWPAGLPLRK